MDKSLGKESVYNFMIRWYILGGNINTKKCIYIFTINIQNFVQRWVYDEKNCCRWTDRKGKD